MKNLFLSQIKEEINKVEEYLEQILAKEQAPLDRFYQHLLQAKGKLLRSGLCILAGKFGSAYHFAGLLPVAAAVELIHLATLIHDDVIDLAQIRRGNTTVNAHFGNMMAVLTGDSLFARAFLLLAQQKKPFLLETISQVVVAICQGETEQILNVFNLEQAEKDYFQRVEKKTAAFLAASCALGARISEAREDIVHSLENYGFNLGMAFQITDDFLDLVGDAKAMGKVPGSDLRQGIMSLPVIYALKNSSNRQELRRILEQKSLSEEEFAQVLELILESGALEYAQDKACVYLEKARKSLLNLTRQESRESLENILLFIEQDFRLLQKK